MSALPTPTLGAGERVCTFLVGGAAMRRNQTGTKPEFEHPENLRRLLIRLDQAGPGAWRTDPDAARLMEHAAKKYAALAKKHGLDPWEAATAAFEAMRTASARRADDPWGVITRAVQITCIAEGRAHGLLCSVHQARRPRYAQFHDAERFSDRENQLTDYHPAFHATTSPFDEDETSDDDIHGVSAAVGDTILLFTLLGWDQPVTRAAVELVCARLAESSSRAGAYESLRRDRHARALLDLPSDAWFRMLRILLGTPDAHLAGTNVGRGVLLRLLIGEPLSYLLCDNELVSMIIRAVPATQCRHDL